MKETPLYFFVGVMVGIVIMFFSLQYPAEAQAYFTALALIGILFAYLQFLHDKSEKENLFVIDQLHFFRSEILKKYEKIVDQIKKDNPNFDFKSIETGKLENFNYGYLYTTYTKPFKEQDKFNKDKNLQVLLVGFLNSLEEFSWNVILHKTINHHALNVVQNPFVSFVEQFAHQILFFRAINPKQYEGVHTIYKKWSQNILRESREETIERIVQEYELCR